MDKDQDELLSLTESQKKAITQLKQAMAVCSRSGLYLWDDHGVISAVNGKHVTSISTDDSYGEPFDRLNATNLTGVRCWHGSNADDPLFVDLK
jgi:hypothetical protein